MKRPIPLRRMIATVAALAALATPPLYAASPNRDDPAPSAQQVKEAMTKAANYLLSLKTGNNFETYGQPWAPQCFAPNTGGETAVITYALLHAGRSLDDARFEPTSPELAPVIDYLSKLSFDGTYAAGITALALAFLPKSEVNRARFTNAVGYLEGTLNRDPQNRKNNGGFTYIYPMNRGMRMEMFNRIDKLLTHNADNDGLLKGLRSAAYAGSQRMDWGNPDGSNSQYGVLGFQAIANEGIDVPAAAWAMMDNFWRNDQRPDGTFGYVIGATDQRPAITAAGVASLFITTRELDTQIRLVPREDKGITAGMAALVTGFKPDSGDTYYGYGLTRVGLASGRKFFGDHNWFRELAAATINRQGADGTFTGGFYDSGNSKGLNTAYSLLILARGQNAIPFNKLQYDGPWDARPYDLANLVEWMGDQYEKEFNWQTVPLAKDPNEWMDAPVLLITGSQELKFTPAEEAKIKTFIDMGGLVFSSTDGATSGFDRSVRDLMQHLYPNDKILRLTKTNPLFTGELHTKPIHDPPPLFGISNGVRLLWIHSPADMGAAWARRSYYDLTDFTTPLNIYFYATSSDLHRTRLSDPVIHPGAAAMTQHMTVERVHLGDNWNPEPFAWQRLSLIAKADLLIGLTVSDGYPNQLANDKPTLAALTGTTAFTASDNDLQSLQAYINGGGTLLVDAAGGNDAFTDSFVALAPKLVPGATLQDIPLNDPIYKSAIAGANAIDQVTFRQYARIHAHALSGEMTKPVLRGIKIKGRWAVIFSEYDITSGLLGTETWGINGYAPDSAVALAENILLYAAHPPK